MHTSTVRGRGGGGTIWRGRSSHGAADHVGGPRRPPHHLGYRRLCDGARARRRAAPAAQSPRLPTSLRRCTGGQARSLARMPGSSRVLVSAASWQPSGGALGRPSADTARGHAGRMRLSPEHVRGCMSQPRVTCIVACMLWQHVPAHAPKSSSSVTSPRSWPSSKMCECGAGGIPVPSCNTCCNAVASQSTRGRSGARAWSAVDPSQCASERCHVEGCA